MEKRTIPVFILISLSFILISSSLSCKKEASKKTSLETAPLVGAEIDIQKLENLIGIQFNILKTEVIGYTPLHKFYWASLKEKVNNQKVEELAHEIIKEIILKKPKTFHSFTIHFFWEDQLAETVESSKPFARANFLPEGGWIKVGRIPIDDYKNYRLTCSFLE